MDMQYTVTLPIEPVCKAYLQHKFGETIVLQRKNWFTRAAIPLLEKQIHQHEDRYKQLSDSIELSVSMDMGDRFGFDISKVNAYQLNALVKETMMQEFFTYMEVATIVLPIKVSINIFQKRFNINIDVRDYETWKKAYYRYREEKKQKEEKTLGMLSPEIKM